MERSCLRSCHARIARGPTTSGTPPRSAGETRRRQSLLDRSAGCQTGRATSCLSGTFPFCLPVGKIAADVDGTSGLDQGAGHGPHAVPPATRWLVRCFLLGFFLCATFGVEVWPLTGFLLFSRLRTETRTIWVAKTVGPSSTETPLWFTDLPRAYQGFGLIMRGFVKLSPTGKAATCQAWLAEARRVRASVVALRIYRLSWRALPRMGEGPAPPVRTLTYACT